VKTIRDLADNRFVLAVQEIVRLAEGPSALALHHDAGPREEAAEGGASAGLQAHGVEDGGGGR
jgi:hypothetical protein